MNSSPAPLHSSFVDPGEKIAGVSLIVIAALMVFAMLHHPIPHSHSFDEFVLEVQSLNALNQWVHGGAIVMLVGIHVGSTYFANRLGRDRLPVRLAITGFFVGCTAMVVAAMFSGFVVPTYLSHLDPASEMELGKNGLRAMRSVNKCFDILGVVGLSWGVFQFGLAGLLQNPRRWWIGGIGTGVGILGIVGIFTGHTTADASGVLVFSMIFSIWLVASGSFLIRHSTTQP